MLDENLFRQESHPAPSRMFANLNWEHPSILEAVQDFFGSKIVSSLAANSFLPNAGKDISDTCSEQTRNFHILFVVLASECHSILGWSHQNSLPF